MVSPPSIRLTGLRLYPVKSLQGISIDGGTVDALGLLHDRRFLVVDDGGRFLTQRTWPRMASIGTALDADHLTLSAEGHGHRRVPLREIDAPLRTVGVWGSKGLNAEDCGDEIAGWLSDFLKVGCRLVRIGDAFDRPVSKGDFARSGDVVGFADAFPFLIVSEASLAELNRRILEGDGAPVPMDRFRSNLIVDGCEPFAEDTWSRFQFGDVVFRSGGPCIRCIMTTTDQRTGERGKEPLRTLARFRRDPEDPSQVRFAQNLIHESKRGTLRVGDVLRLL